MYSQTVHWGGGERGFSLSSTCRGFIDLCFTVEDLSLFDDKEILAICNWFRENGEHIISLYAIMSGGYSHAPWEGEALALAISDECNDSYVKHLVGLALDKIRTVGRESHQKTEFSKPKPSSGWVYVLKADNGIYKIGKTQNLDKRVTSLEIQLPYELEVVLTIPSDDITTLESELHTMYESKRLKGEWFKLDDNDLQFIEAVKTGRAIIEAIRTETAK